MIIRYTCSHSLSLSPSLSLPLLVAFFSLSLILSTCLVMLNLFPTSHFMVKVVMHTCTISVRHTSVPVLLGVVGLEGSQVEEVHLDLQGRGHLAEVAVNKGVGLQKEIQWAVVRVCVIHLILKLFIYQSVL